MRPITLSNQPGSTPQAALLAQGGGQGEASGSGPSQEQDAEDLGPNSQGAMHLVQPGTRRGCGAQVLTVLVDPHGRGCDVRRHVEVGEPQILQGHKGLIRDVLQPRVLLWGLCKAPRSLGKAGLQGTPLPAGGIAQGCPARRYFECSPPGPPPSFLDLPTSICLSWKTLLMLVLKAEPENMEVMG